MKRILIVLVFLSLVCLRADAQDAAVNPSVKFYEANLLYKQGQYEKAIASYEEVLKEGFADGALYYNLGNSYIKLHQPGKAILDYERAKLFIPRDSDLQANLDYALSLSKSPAAPAEISFISRILTYYQEALTVREMMWLTVALCLILGIAVFAAEVFQLSAGKRWIVISILAILTFGQGAAWVGKSYHLKKTAVILKDTQAKFEPNDQATQHFYLFPGEKIVILKVEGDWAKVRRPDGKLGWVKVSDFEKIL